MPSAAGGIVRPMTPATATSVRRYGSAVKSVEIEVEYVCRLTPRALENPKSRHAAAAPNGFQPPKMSAASAMNPRPAVMFSVNALPSPIERYAPPAPARMPDMITEAYRTLLKRVPHRLWLAGARGRGTERAGRLET